MSVVRRRAPRPARLPRRRWPKCVCGEKLRRFWRYCPRCARAQVWPDDKGKTGADCGTCGWVVADSFSYCPWCQADIYVEGVSSEVALKAPTGFQFHARCGAGCGGGVQYPMSYCPWCSKAQSWNEEWVFDGACPHCDGGVDDTMDRCVWCGEDATGRELIVRALRRVRRLLRVARVPAWDYRVLLRPGVSGVDPAYPNAIEIERGYVVDKKSRGEIPWRLLVGLVLHELGHSFLYQHWYWTRDPRFIQAFGHVDKAYRVRDDLFVDFNRRYVAISPVDHVSTYAHVHPQEDFAETFRFYTTRRGKLRELFAELGQKHKGVPVYEKFLALHDFLRRLRAQNGPPRRPSSWPRPR
jgi:hypothetical protein